MRPRSTSELRKWQPIRSNAARMRSCAGSGPTRIGSKSPLSVDLAISSYVRSPTRTPGSSRPPIMLNGVSSGSPK